MEQLHNNESHGSDKSEAGKVQADNRDDAREEAGCGVQAAATGHFLGLQGDSTRLLSWGTLSRQPAPTRIPGLQAEGKSDLSCSGPLISNSSGGQQTLGKGSLTAPLEVIRLLSS